MGRREIGEGNGKGGQKREAEHIEMCGGGWGGRGCEEEVLKQ